MMAVLFLSSYGPLFALLALRTYEKSMTLFWLAVAALAISGLGVAIFFFAVAKRAKERHWIVATEDHNGDVAAYAATYLLPFLAIFGASWRDVLALALFIVIIGVIYVESEMIYINPLLSLLGYHLFSVQTTTAFGGPTSDSPRSRWLICKRTAVGEGEPVVVRQVAGATLVAFARDQK